MVLSQDTLLAILAAVLIADVLVVVVALIWTQVQRRRHRDEVAPPLPVQPNTRTTTGATPIMSRPFPAASTPASNPTSSYGAGSGAPGYAAAAYGAATSGSGAGGPGGTASGYAAGTSGSPAFAGSAPGFNAGSAPYGTAGAGYAAPTTDLGIDSLTGLLTTGAGSRTVVDEEARIRRYHRPATIVIIEVEGLERLIARLGPGSVDRIVPAVADTIRRGAREADHVARLSTGRFAVLMPETDEILAINFIERIRKACDLWLESGAVSLRLAIGWASSTGDGSLVDAEALATDRMYGELRRVARANGDGPAGLGNQGGYGTGDAGGYGAADPGYGPGPSGYEPAVGG